MTKRHVYFMVGLVALGTVSAATWRACNTVLPSSFPPVHVAEPERPDPDAPEEMKVLRSGPGPDEAIGDLVAEADAVLTVRLSSSRTDRVDLQLKPIPFSYTIYDFAVLESIKGSFASGATVRIARSGGRGTYETDFPRPGLGEQFVVFLKWFPKVNAYRHLYGPETLRIVYGEVQPMSPLYRDLSGRKLGDVLRELRKRVKNTE